MFAGTTRYPVGTKVRITQIALEDGEDADDLDLEGQVGELTHPFRGLMWPGVTYLAGVRLPNDQRVNLAEGDRFEPVEEALAA